MAYNRYDAGILYDSGAKYKEYAPTAYGTSVDGRITFDCFGLIPHGEVNSTLVAIMRGKYHVHMHYFEQSYQLSIYRDGVLIFSASDPSLSSASVSMVGSIITVSNFDKTFNATATDSTYSASGSWVVYTDFANDVQYDDLDTPDVPKPTLTATLAGSSVTLVASSAGASLYRFYRSNGTTAGLLIATQSSGTYVDTLSSSGIYTYTALASSAVGAYSPLSDPASVTFAAASAPDAPTLSASSSNGLVTLVASAVVGASGYKFYRDGALIGTSQTTTVYDQPATGTYSYTVKAYNDVGDSDASNAVAVSHVAQSAPAAPVLIATRSGSVVTLSAYSDGADAYDFFVDGDDIPNPGGHGEVTYDLVAYGIYTFTAVARNGAGESAASDAAVVTYSAPASLESGTSVDGRLEFDLADFDDNDGYEETIGSLRGSYLLTYNDISKFIYIRRANQSLVGRYYATSGRITVQLVGDTFTITRNGVVLPDQYGTGTDSTYTAAGLYAITDYARCSNVSYIDLDTPTVELPSKPTLTASITGNVVTLSANATAATGYRLYENGTQRAIRADGAFTRTLGYYGTFTYKVVAYNDSGDSVESDEVPVVYSQPVAPPPQDSGLVGTTIYTFPTGGNDVRFAVLLDKLFMTNGVDPIMCWDGDTANSPVAVTDRTSAGPVFPYIVTFRDRLWLAGRGSTVMYCGTADTELVEGIETEMPRWKNWSGSLPSDGGSLVVGADDGQIVTGLAHINDGLIVFKSRNTYLWTYGDDAIPKTEGSIIPLVRGVGCASHDTIRYRNGSVVFLGQSDDGDYAVYSLNGSSSVVLSQPIPDAIARIVTTSNNPPRAFIHDDVYYLACDEVGSDGVRTLVYAYDFTMKCWYEIRGWSVGAFGRTNDGKRLRIGSSETSAVYEYPLGVTDSSGPIEWGLSLRTLDGGNALMDHRWRNVYADVRTSSSMQPLDVHVSEDGGADLTFPTTIGHGPLPKYDDGSKYDADLRYPNVQQDKRVSVPLGSRCRTIQLSISGSSDSDTSVQRVGATLRDRKVRG